VSYEAKISGAIARASGLQPASAGASAPVPAAETLAALLGSRRSLPRFLVGAVVLELASVGDTLLLAPSKYGGPRDVALQWAAACVGEVVLASTLLAVFVALYRIDRRLARWQRMSRWAFVSLVGLTPGLLWWQFIVRPSHLGPLFPTWVLAALSAAAGLLCTFVPWRVAQSRIPRHPALVACALLASAVAIYTFGLHNFIPKYGNVHLPLVILSSSLAGVSGILVGHAFELDSRRLVVLTGGQLAVALSILSVIAPTLSARRLVLRHGGTVKLLCGLVLWPLADRDGDGTPARFWGSDPDNLDPTVTALTLGRSPPAPPVGPTLPRPHRSIVLMLFDTLRSDTFGAITSREAKVAEAFATFAEYPEYRTCSTTTSQVLMQVLGDQGCRVAGAPRGLWNTLHEAGYEDVHFGSIVFSAPTFSVTITDPTDEATLERAGNWIAARSAAAPPAFAFVHLRGGHHSYRGRGDTDAEQYQDQVSRTLGSVAGFVEGRDWVTVLLGDHGEEFGEHSQFHHGSNLYEPTLRTAFLLRSPGVAPGRSPDRIGCPDAVNAIAAAAADVPAPPTMGFQFASLELKRGTLGFLYDSYLRARIDGERKVVWEPQLGIWEEYDVARDPDEKHDLLMRSPQDLPTLVAAMAAAVRACNAMAPPSRTPSIVYMADPSN
jgi:hypothetical protein